MRQTDLKDKSSVFFISKWIIITAITVVASLGFTLGFFVGKSFRAPAENTPPLVPASLNPDEMPVAAVEKGTVPQKTEQSQDIKPLAQADKTEELLKIQDKKKSQVSPEPKKTEETKKSEGSQDEKAATKAKKYTVQAGAFRNASDADSLRAKLVKKGYKAAVTAIDTKKHEKLYKVLVGEFSSRKEADLLAVKLKKSEGLKPFVTFNP